jgi:hypothetical protein
MKNEKPIASKIVKASLPAHLKKKAKVARPYKKLVSAQKIVALTKSNNLKRSCKSCGVSKRTAIRIRVAERDGKLSASSMKRLRDRCINEAIRQLQYQPQKRLAHNVNAKHVREFFQSSIKNNKEFAPLKGKKTPHLNMFRAFLNDHKKASSEGKIVFRKQWLKNTGITEEQWRGRERNVYNN